MSLKPDVEGLEIVEISWLGDRSAVEEIAGGDEGAVNQQCVWATYVQIFVRHTGAEGRPGDPDGHPETAAGDRFNRHFTAEDGRQQITDNEILDFFVALHGANRRAFEKTMLLVPASVLMVMMMLMLMKLLIIIPARMIRCGGRRLGDDRPRRPPPS